MFKWVSRPGRGANYSSPTAHSTDKVKWSTFISSLFLNTILGQEISLKPFLCKFSCTHTHIQCRWQSKSWKHFKKKQQQLFWLNMCHCKWQQNLNKFKKFKSIILHTFRTLPVDRFSYIIYLFKAEYKYASVSNQMNKRNVPNVGTRSLLGSS